MLPPFLAELLVKLDDLISRFEYTSKNTPPSYNTLLFVKEEFIIVLLCFDSVISSPSPEPFRNVATPPNNA